jgi:hypothetical protein
MLVSSKREFSLGRRQLEAAAQRFAVAFTGRAGKKKGFMNDGVKGKRVGWELDDDVLDLTLCSLEPRSSSRLRALPHSRSSVEDKSVLACKVYK